jgi:hypothetical protein
VITPAPAVTLVDFESPMGYVQLILEVSVLAGTVLELRRTPRRVD